MSESKTPADDQWSGPPIAEQLELEDAPGMLTTTQVSKILGVSSQTVINWIEEGELPAMKLPGGTGQRRKFRVPLRGLLRILHTNHAMEKDDLQDIVEEAKRSAGNS